MADITTPVKGKHKARAIFVVTGVALATFVGIMYFKKCYVVINKKRYGIIPNT